MQREIILKHEIVEYIPDDIKEGTIYISVTFATAVHKCCCGCRNQVVTPLSPTDWKLTFDGKFISLDPSIGNWGFPCQSHYWIRRNRVQWAPRWSKKQIDAGRLYDKMTKKKYFEGMWNAPAESDTGPKKEGQSEEKPTEGLWHKAKSWWA
jgi:hypothetical protein